MVARAPLVVLAVADDADGGVGSAVHLAPPERPGVIVREAVVFIAAFVISYVVMFLVVTWALGRRRN